MTKAIPKLEYRDPQPYVGIRSCVTMKEIGTVLPPLMGEVFAWLEKKGLKASGAPFWRYLVVDMKRQLEIDVAVPVAAALKGDGRIISDVLPPGRYATTLHVGHPDGLMQATADLLSWAEENGIMWQVDGSQWAGRVERYFSNPIDDPDMNMWKTELAFLSAD